MVVEVVLVVAMVMVAGPNARRAHGGTWRAAGQGRGRGAARITIGGLWQLRVEAV